MRIQDTNQKAGYEFKSYLTRLACSVPGKFLLSVPVMLSLLAIPLLSRAAGPNGAEQSDHRVEGSWIISVHPILPPGVPPVTVQTYITFSAGGGSIGSDRTKPFASPQHGTWTHLQGHQFAWTFVQDLFDPAGNFLGVFKGRTLAELIDENTFVGVANVETRDPNGNLQANRCARFEGKRVVVEPLAPPCELLEP